MFTMPYRDAGAGSSNADSEDEYEYEYDENEIEVSQSRLHTWETPRTRPTIRNSKLTSLPDILCGPGLIILEWSDPAETSKQKETRTNRYQDRQPGGHSGGQYSHTYSCTSRNSNWKCNSTGGKWRHTTDCPFRTQRNNTRSSGARH